MVNYKLVLKRIRRNEVKCIVNCYQYKIVCNVMKKFREMIDKKEVEKMFFEVVFMLDRLVKKNIIYVNKVVNLKFSLVKYVVVI